LTRYLSDNWVPVIEKDVDGPNALPLQMDGEIPNLGKFAACRRVARTIYMGSAPITKAAHRGIEDRRVKLGCLIPGESPSVFGDALRRLAGVATYLYQDGPRYWYSTQPTVTKLAEDRAEQLKRDPDKISQELNRRIRLDITEDRREKTHRKGDFSRIHPMPQSGQDVPDDLDARLVVLGINSPYSKEAGNPAEISAKAILESRGNAPRLYRNTLVFLAADKTRLQDLDEAIRKFLAWESILAEKGERGLNLDPQQVTQAENQKTAADATVSARIPETYQWLLVPIQSTPQETTIDWQVIRLTGQEPLAERASKKLKKDELLITSFAPSRLRMELDRIPLWRGNHVAIKQLIEDFSKYPYLSRLKDPSVLVDTICKGLALITWGKDAFAFADSFDETEGRYRGLRAGQLVSIPDADAPGLIVKPEIALKQMEAERPKPVPTATTMSTGTGNQGITDSTAGEGKTKTIEPKPVPEAIQPKRFHGTVALDPTRVGRDAGRIAEEVIAHLSGIINAKVTVTLEIEAEIPSGASDHVVRTVTENSRTLKFTSQGFEEE
jgi:hypothetical protein